MAQRPRKQPYERFPVLAVEAETIPIPPGLPRLVPYMPKVDSAGGFWFPGIRERRGGVVRYHEGVWREWPLPSDEFLLYFAEFRGRMYGCSRRLMALREDGWSVLAAPADAGAIVAQGDRYLWAGSSGYGPWRSPDGVEWEPVPHPPCHDSAVNALACRADGTMVLASRGARSPIPTPLWLWDEQSWHKIDPPDHKHFYYVIKLWCPPDGSVWALTSRGLWRWDGRDWDHVSAPPKRSLRTPYPIDVAIDSARDLCITSSATCGLLARRAGRLVRLEERPNRRQPEPYLPYAGALWLSNDRLWILPAPDCLQSIDLAQLDAL